VQSAPRACTPARRRDWGSKGKGGRGGGGSPGLHKRISAVSVSGFCGPRGRSGRPPRPVPDLPGLHPCPREGGALSSQIEKGRLCRSEAEASRQSRDRLKRHPQEGQHSAASWGDPGPSASGERLNRAITCCAMGLKPTDRDVSRLGSRKPGAAEPHAPLLIILCGVSLLSGLHVSKTFALAASAHQHFQ
jgi:hypothetical protein